MTAGRRNHYEVLGVQRNASRQEIHQAFRQLARQRHPDVSDSKDAAARFQELSSAYEVLHDPSERARYDDAAIPVHRPPPAHAPQRPTFVTRRASRPVPRFLETEAPMPQPAVIRVAVFRWLS
jgi:curved DNA-binding protein CbpA